jgi:hypothetical protein
MHPMYNRGMFMRKTHQACTLCKNVLSRIALPMILSAYSRFLGDRVPGSL